MMQLSSCNTILDSCDLGPNGSFFPHNPGGGAPEINLSGGEIELFGTRIHDIGLVGGYHEVLGHYQGSAPRSIRTLGCTIEQNLLSNYYNPGSPSANEFVLDSSVIRNNQIAFGLFPGGIPRQCTQQSSQEIV
ncbi:MAG: hypothetical protein IPP40_11390 [bacterium]|nr:hypothetical protein [bacterium]